VTGDGIFQSCQSLSPRRSLIFPAAGFGASEINKS
jgi:hypothetical protein